MITKEQFISDVILQLTQSAPSDDLELEDKQIAIWGTYHLNQLVATECNEKTKRGEQIPSIYVKRTELEVSELEEEAGVNESDERIFVTLDEEILDLNKDAGVVMVETDERDEVKKMNFADSQIFKHMRFGKPSLENLLYYRQGQKIYVEGFKSVDIPFNSLFIYYVPKQDLLTMDDEDEILVSDLVLPELINAVVQRGKLQLYGTQQDEENDGQDNKEVQYHRAIQRPE